MKYYRVYGWSLAATAPIDGLIEQRKPDAVDYTIVAGEWPESSVHGETLEYADGTRFLVTPDRIWCTWTTTAEDAATYLLGPVLAYALRLRGVLSLHASAVVIDDRAVVIAAAHGQGKSTTAAAFARRGHAILSDDVVPLVIGDDVIAQPGYPRIRLWEDVAAQWFGDLPAMTPNWPKRYLDVTPQFRSIPAPVAALYILGEGSDGATQIVPLHGAAAALSVIRNTSMNLALDARMRAEELELVARLVQRVRVAEVRPPRGLERVDELCEVLVRDSSRV